MTLTETERARLQGDTPNCPRCKGRGYTVKDGDVRVCLCRPKEKWSRCPECYEFTVMRVHECAADREDAGAR